MTKIVAVLICISPFVALGCIDNTSYATQERSDKIAQYILKTAPKVQHPADIDLEGKIQYLGYDLKADNPRAGSNVEVTWYWKIKQELGPGWRLFTHAVGSGEEKFNRDGVGPVRESFQPEHWRTGMIVKDHQSFKIPKDWSSETLDIRVGIWKGPSRLKGKDGMDSSNRIIGPALKVSTKPAKPPVNIAYAKTAPKIDGKFDDEEAWKDATVLGAFVNTMKGTPVDAKTETKIMWDENYLYVAFHAQDKTLTSQYDTHDDELWHEDAFEIFIDPKGDKKDYYELQVSPKGIVFDSYLPRYRKNKNEWSSNMTVAVVVDGTVNNASDTDTGWSGEMAIPFETMKTGGGVPPKDGDVWAVNFFRIDKGGDTTTYSGWSPPMRGDFHTLGKFGRVTFEKKPAPREGAVQTSEPPPPPSEEKPSTDKKPSKSDALPPVV